MKFVVAGVVAVLAFAAATASWVFAPIYQNKAVGDGGEPVLPASAPTFCSALKALKMAEIAVFSLLAAVCGVAVWSVCNGGAGAAALARYTGVALALLCAAVFDRRTHLIPNFLILSMFFFGVIILGGEFLFDRSTFLPAFVSAIVGLVFCFPVFYLLCVVTRDGLGMGDVKLISAMAWLLGAPITLLSVLFGLILCALVAIGLMLTKKKNKTDFIPFGPFLFGGYLLLIIFFSV